MSRFESVVQIATCAVIFAAASPANAQSGPCFNNLVPNGGFTLFPSWTLTGGATMAPAMAAVNGVNTSLCLAFTNLTGTAFTVRQPAPLSLNANMTYEFSLDVWHDKNRLGDRYRWDVGITDTNGVRTLVGSGQTGQVQTLTLPNTNNLSRVAFRFDLASLMLPTGSYQVDVQIDPVAVISTIRIDNAVIHEARGPFFNLVNQGRRAGFWNSEYMVITPTGNQPFLLAASFAPLRTTPLNIPGCNPGNVWLANPILTIKFASTNMNGVFGPPTGTMFPMATLGTIPAVVGGLPIWWQVGTLPTPSSPCSIGCPHMIAFSR